MSVAFEITRAALLVVVGTIIGLLPDGARAETLQVIKPGVACSSADALAKLTLPDGSSRSERPNAPQFYRQIADQGGCIALKLNESMIAVEIRNRTDIVLFDPADGKGKRDFYIAKMNVAALQASAADIPFVHGNALPNTTAESLHPSTGDSVPNTKTDGKGREFTTGLITLDVNFDEAKTKFSKGFHVFTGNAHSQSLPVFVALSSDESERYVVEGFHGQVVYVLHFQKFAADQQPLTDTVLELLRQRYGEKSSMGSTRTYLGGTQLDVAWSFDKSGIQLRNSFGCHAEDNLDPSGGNEGSDIVFDKQPSEAEKSQYVTFTAPTSNAYLMGLCYKVVHVKSAWGLNRSLVSTLITRLQDSQPIQDYEAEQSRKRAEEEARQNEAAKKIAPKL